MSGYRSCFGCKFRGGAEKDGIASCHLSGVVTTTGSATCTFVMVEHYFLCFFLFLQVLCVQMQLFRRVKQRPSHSAPTAVAELQGGHRQDVRFATVATPQLQQRPCCKEGIVRLILHSRTCSGAEKDRVAKFCHRFSSMYVIVAFSSAMLGRGRERFFSCCAAAAEVPKQCGHVG